MDKEFFRVVEFDGHGNAVSKCKVSLLEEPAKMWAEMCNHYKSVGLEKCYRFVAMEEIDPIVQRINTFTDDIR